MPALDDALNLIAPSAAPAPAATVAHHRLYREAVSLVAAGTGIPSDRAGEFLEAFKLLGISQDVFVADVKAFKDADQLRTTAATRDRLNADLVRVNDLANAFEDEVKRRRQELLDGRNGLIGQIQSADLAATKLADLERTNPRLFG